MQGAALLATSGTTVVLGFECELSDNENSDAILISDSDSLLVLNYGATFSGNTHADINNDAGGTVVCCSSTCPASRQVPRIPESRSTTAHAEIESHFGLPGHQTLFDQLCALKQIFSNAMAYCI